MNKKLKTYRHGEILLVEAKEIPKEAKIKNTDVFLVGSHQNPHSFKGGKFYELNGEKGIFGYFEAQNTRLYHKEHGDPIQVGELKEAKLPDGIYELRKGQEYTPEGLKIIVD